MVRLPAVLPETGAYAVRPPWISDELGYSASLKVFDVKKFTLWCWSRSLALFVWACFRSTPVAAGMMALLPP